MKWGMSGQGEAAGPIDKYVLSKVGKRLNSSDYESFPSNIQNDRYQILKCGITRYHNLRQKEEAGERPFLR